MVEQYRAAIELNDISRASELKAKINQIRTKYGLLSIAQLKPMPELKEFELKPYKYPGDPDPVQPITTCRWCNSHLNEKEMVCHNCGRNQIDKGQPYQRKVPKPKNGNPDGVYLPQHTNIVNAGKKDKVKKPIDGVHKSDEFHMCKDPKGIKNKKKADDIEESIKMSCIDLAIDG